MSEKLKPLSIQLLADLFNITREMLLKAIENPPGDNYDYVKQLKSAGIFYYTAMDMCKIFETLTPDEISLLDLEIRGKVDEFTSVAISGVIPE